MKETRWFSIAVHLGLAAIGPGMLTLPYGLSHTGLICGMLEMAVSVSLSAMSVVHIYDAALYVTTRKNIKPPASYGSLVNQILDRRYQILLDLAVVISGYGAAISFLIFLGDFIPLTFKAMCSQCTGPVASLLGSREPVIIFVAFIVALLSTADNGVSHWTLTAAPVLGFGFCAACLVFRWFRPFGEKTHGISVAQFAARPPSILALPDINLFFFAFMMQANVLPTINAFSQSTEPLGSELLPGPRKRLAGLRRSELVRGVCASHSAVFVYYCLLGILGVLLVLNDDPTSTIAQNFTQSLPMNDPVNTLMRCVLIVSLVTISPYLFSAVANGCRNLVAVVRNQPEFFDHFGAFNERLTYSSFLVFASGLLALQTDKVATVITVLGGWGATCLMSTVPGVLIYKMDNDRLKHEGDFEITCTRKAQYCIYVITSVIGCLASILPYWISE